MTAKNKRLVRKSDEEPYDSREASSVKATGVTFKPSSELEEGFGCRRVAYCETVEAIYPPRVKTGQVTFDGRETFMLDGEPVETLLELNLPAEGPMTGIMEVSE